MGQGCFCAWLFACGSFSSSFTTQVHWSTLWPRRWSFLESLWGVSESTRSWFVFSGIAIHRRRNSGSLRVKRYVCDSGLSILDLNRLTRLERLSFESQAFITSKSADVIATLCSLQQLNLNTCCTLAPQSIRQVPNAVFGSYMIPAHVLVVCNSAWLDRSRPFWNADFWWGIAVFPYQPHASAATFPQWDYCQRYATDLKARSLNVSLLKRMRRCHWPKYLCCNCALFPSMASSSISSLLRFSQENWVFSCRTVLRWPDLSLSMQSLRNRSFSCSLPFWITFVHPVGSQTRLPLRSP